MVDCLSSVEASSESRSRLITRDEASKVLAQQNTTTPFVHIDVRDSILGLCVEQHVFVRLRRKTSTQGGGEMVQRASCHRRNAKDHPVKYVLFPLYLSQLMLIAEGKGNLGNVTDHDTIPQVRFCVYLQVLTYR